MTFICIINFNIIFGIKAFKYEAFENGVGFIAFSPLAQGLLTDRYINGIPEDLRVARGGFLKKEAFTPEMLAKISEFNRIVLELGQTLAEMLLAWLFKDNKVTSVIVGASSVEQLSDNSKALKNTSFDEAEFKYIDEIIKG